MLQECLDSDSRFGVTLIQEGTEVGEPAVPQDIGTVARIVQVNRIEGDRYFVSAIGERRFRIVEVTRRTPFISARVELLGEVGDTPVSENVINEAIDLFGEYARFSVGTTGGWVSDTKVPADPARPLLSYCRQDADGPLRQTAPLGGRDCRRETRRGDRDAEEEFPRPSGSR